MKIIYIILIAFILFEIFIYLIFDKLKKSKWILTKKELSLLFDKDKFNKFKKINYDFELGWAQIKKDNTINKTKKNVITYNIDKKGYRSSKNKLKSNIITSFGDSYTFCRQISDEKTWQEIISKKKNIFVSNYGVGNYGLDQAYLKLKKTKVSKKTKVISFGFVPETICRIQSSWKNYLEFGNLHGFKPYCKLHKNKIKIKPNPLKKKHSFKDLKKIINQTKKNDRFYKDKYLKNYFFFPFTLSFLKNFNFNIKIFLSFLFYPNKKNIKYFDDYIFPFVMERNIEFSHKLYKEVYSANLLKSLISEIYKYSNRKKVKVCFVIFPQLYDIKKNSRINYQSFFNKYKIF